MKNMRGRSDAPSSPRGGYAIRRRSPSPKRGSAAQDDRENGTSLLIRNLRLDCSVEDLQVPFRQFGTLKNIYLPRDYHTGQPTGFGFIEFANPAEAKDAKHKMDDEILLGRKLIVSFAKYTRKKPAGMRATKRLRGRSHDERRSSRSPRHSRCSPPRWFARDLSRSPGYSPSYRLRGYSRRVSRERSRSMPRHSRDKSHSRSSARNGSRSRISNPTGERVRSPQAEANSWEPSREPYPGTCLRPQEEATETGFLKHMRGRSYTPLPPRGAYERKRSPSPSGRYAARHDRDYPTTLLVRNLHHSCRPEDLRTPFEQFGPLEDIYLPKDYYTGQQRSYGFVKFEDHTDAARAKSQMDGRILRGRELNVVYPEANRKSPASMRAKDRSGDRFYKRRRSPPSNSRSPPPRYA